MPLHPLWILLVLFTAALLVAIGVLLARSGGARPDHAPVLSPDGRHWWDGQRWQPMPPATPPASKSGSGTA